MAAEPAEQPRQQRRPRGRGHHRGRWRSSPGGHPGWDAAAAGAAAIAQTGIPGGQQTTAYLVFALISTPGVGIPVAIYFAMGARSERLLIGLKDWMNAHNAAIMTILCLIIAVKLIGHRISSLAG